MFSCKYKRLLHRQIFPVNYKKNSQVLLAGKMVWFLNTIRKLVKKSFFTTVAMLKKLDRNFFFQIEAVLDYVVVFGSH
jgi:hypothetical protein